MHACFAGKTNLVSLLLERRATVDHANDAGKTALHVTSEQGHADIAALLLERGAAPERIQPATGFSPLMMSAYFGHVEVARLLVQWGAALDRCDHSGHTALMWASGWGQTAVVTELRNQVQALQE